MSQRKMTKAEKATAAANKSSAGKAAIAPKKPKDQKPAKGEQLSVEQLKGPRWTLRFPGRTALAVFCLILFFMLVMILIGEQGLVLEFVKSAYLGLFGQVVLQLSLIGLPWLFFVLLLSENQPIRMRCCCTLGFLFLCGCIHHLCCPQMDLTQNFLFVVIPELFRGGIAGTTGGLLCGIVAELVKLCFDKVASMILLTVGAVLCLMGAVDLTVPALYRAIRNYSRLEEGEPDGRNTAEILVDAIADWRKTRREKKNQKWVAREARDAGVEPPGEETTLLEKFWRLLDQIVKFDREIPEPEGTTEEAEPVEKPKKPRKPKAPKEPVTVKPDDADVIAGVAVEPDTAGAEKAAPAQEPAENPARKKVTAKEADQSAREIEEEIKKDKLVEKPAYQFPPLDLLQKPKGTAGDGTAEMRENSRRLNDALESFKIEAHITNVTRGPSVTRYEVELEKGVRLNKLTSAADDIALNLGASGVRIAPVPGKISVVGIEVPNQTVTTVSLREVIGSGEFTKAKDKSSFAVGKDIGGNCIIGNISKLPHMLIAGTTGSGKSVCMNSIIISLLYKASPDEVKLIMVDPKMVELGIYNGIPHLLIPVVTDPKKAAGSLQWAVTEMMRRYRSMSDVGVRDLESYNAMIDGEMVEGERLPQVVVIIDELADLMLVAAKEVEESICRIAQMGRAAGVHLVIATQRPSADVITGLMKANIPSRIAFSVSSAMESRIILDNPGAEKLVGKGDMLFAPIGNGKPQRIQGCFVSDVEVERVTNFIKTNYASTYNQEVMDEIEKAVSQTGGKSASEPEANPDELAGDEMLPAAVEVILETKQASVSLLQRRLKLGYARAARIMDEMEEMGIVGPFVGSKPRQILITREQWDQMKNGQTVIDEPPFDLDDEGFGPVPDAID